MLLNVTDSGLRAQLMSASLLSDMESFKAANPLGKLDDFIRWYSPRDWIEEDTDGEQCDVTNEPTAWLPTNHVAMLSHY